MRFYTPCTQLNGMHPNLLKAVTFKAKKHITYKAGIMARILREGLVYPGDRISVVSTEDALLEGSRP